MIARPSGHLTSLTGLPVVLAGSVMGCVHVFGISRFSRGIRSLTVAALFTVIACLQVVTEPRPSGSGHRVPTFPRSFKRYFASGSPRDSWPLAGVTSARRRRGEPAIAPTSARESPIETSLNGRIHVRLYLRLRQGRIVDPKIVDDSLDVVTAGPAPDIGIHGRNQLRGGNGSH